MRAITLQDRRRGMPSKKLITHSCEKVDYGNGGYYVRVLCTGRHYARRMSFEMKESAAVNCSNCRGSERFGNCRGEDAA